MAEAQSWRRECQGRADLMAGGLSWLRRTRSARSEKQRLLNQLHSWLCAPSNARCDSRYRQKEHGGAAPISASAPRGTAPVPAGPEAEGPRRAGRPDSFRHRAEPIAAAPAPPPPLPALLPPRGGGGSGVQRCVCARSSCGRASALRSRRLPSAAPRSPLPLFLRCPFPASRGCACEFFFPRILEAPNMFSAVRAQRQQVRRALPGPCGRALFGAGERVEAAARAGGPHSGTCGPTALCCLFGARFLGPRSCPHGLKGVRPGGRAGPGGCGVAPGREFPVPRVCGCGAKVSRCLSRRHAAAAVWHLSKPSVRERGENRANPGLGRN